ncbi:unnamed protein product [Meganyctiphanes norvegica]|uniref:Uncharacterized protein n=1 Tax=Meganyctiphanes norvegica TaxID=48144 RepID=A0AAV2PRI1_MEGNR
MVITKDMFSYYIKPGNSKQASLIPSFQMECFQDISGYSGLTLGMHSGPDECLNSFSDGLDISEVSGLRGGRPDLRFPVPPFWSRQVYQTHQRLHTPSDHYDTFISGRLSYTSPYSGKSSGSDFSYSCLFEKLAFGGNFKKFLLTPSQTEISGGPLPPRLPFSLSHIPRFFKYLHCVRTSTVIAHIVNWRA